MKIGFDMYLLFFVFLLSCHRKTVASAIILLVVSLFVVVKYTIKIIKKRKKG